MSAPSSNPGKRSSRKAWRVLAGLAVAHLAVMLFLNPTEEWRPPRFAWLHYIATGWVLGLPVVFATWAALGPPPAAKRIPLTLVLLAMAIVASGFYQFCLLVDSQVKNGLDPNTVILLLALFVATLLVMSIVRRFANWRIEQRTEDSLDSSPANQFNLKHLLAIITACAVLLGAARGLTDKELWGNEDAWRDMVRDMLPSIAYILLLTIPAIVIPLYALFARPKARVFIILFIAWAALSMLSLGMIVAAENLTWDDVEWDVILMPVGAGFAGIFSALVLRAGGYRLVRRVVTNATGTTPAV
jgi:hypothetical protein